MKSHIQIALVIVMILYLLWALGLLVAPETVHNSLSTGPFDASSSAMFGAGLFAFVLVFMVAVHEPTRELVFVSATGLLFFGLTAAYQIFISKTMPQHPVTVFTLIINLGVAVYLLITLSESVMSATAAPASKRTKAVKKKKKKQAKTAKRRR